MPVAVKWTYRLQLQKTISNVFCFQELGEREVIVPRMSSEEIFGYTGSTRRKLILMFLDIIRFKYL